MWIFFVRSDSNSGHRNRYSDSLRAGRSAIPSLWGARFSAPIETGSGVHPASYTMGTGSSPGLKRSERGVDHPPTYSADVKERVELYVSAGERPAAAHLLRSWVRIPPGAWIFVRCVCRVLSGRGLCDELITHPEESYRLCCVVCDLETSRMGAAYIYKYTYIYIYMHI